jgi:RNA polymerase sigma-70 factor, ECF subfamily
MSDNECPEAIERFVQRLGVHQDRLYAYILMLLPNREAAADVLQETNLVLWQKAAEFDEKRDFGAWACRIAYFQVLAWWRDRNRDRLVFDQRLLDELAADAESLSSELGDHVRALQLCMIRLSDRERELLKHRYHLGLSIKEIACKFGQSPNAIAMALSRTRHELLLCIETVVIEKEDQ